MAHERTDGENDPKDNNTRKEIGEQSDSDSTATRELGLTRRTLLKTTGVATGAGLLGVGAVGNATAISEEALSAYRNVRVQETSKVWERGYRGRPDRTIAVGDTGVDARHPDLGPWNNARVVTTGDGYDLLEVADDGKERTVANLGPYSGTIGPGAADTNAAQYARHEFTTPDEAEQVEATLSWTANTQDLDFYLEDSQGNTVGSSTNFGGPERIKTTVTSDDQYTLVVQTYASVVADYEITGAFFAGGVEQSPFEGSPVPTTVTPTANTPKLIGWLGGTFPRDGGGHGSHVASIMGGSGRGSAIDIESIVEENPRTVLTTGDTLRYEVEATASEGVFISAYGTGIELLIEDPTGQTVETAEVGSDTSESGDVTVAEAFAPTTGTYTTYVRPAGGQTASTGQVERVATGAFVDPDGTAGDRTGETPSLHAGVAPNASLLGIQGLSPALTALSEHGDWFTETFNVRSVNFSFGGLPTERTGTTGIYEQVRQITESGVLVVSSAGNNGPLTGSTGPSGGDEAVSTVATGPMDGITAYSSGGTAVRSEDGEIHRKPDVTAPGGTLTDVVNAVEAGDPESDAPVRGYTGKAGTSMASPYTNGVTGLVAEAMEFDAPSEIALPDPAATGYDDVLRLKQVLLATASETVFTAAPYHRAHAPTYDFGGRDPFEGFGRVNPDAAIDAVSREFSGTTSETVGLNLPADSRAVAGYVRAGPGTLTADVRFSHYSGGNKSAAKGTPHIDLFVYDAAIPAENGDPNVVASGQGLEGSPSAAASFGRNTDESVYYVVAKLVDVPGVFNGDDVQAHFDLTVEFDPGTFVAGTRADDGSVFTAGQTDEMNLTVNPSSAGSVRDAVPSEWTVLVEHSDDIERVEVVNGVQYVYFTDGAMADTNNDYTYFVEAPEEGTPVSDTGQYAFGPVEVEIDGQWVAASGTSESNTVVGLSTNV